MTGLLVLALVLLQAGAPPSLRIVVIEGEDAVNVIQQKTAIRPVVEVRDRNDLPVPGALVTFSIEGGKAASFGGASTLTVATNAAGQAAVTSLTPSAAGAFQIQVQAAFQGQLATATIAQTNVVTAAQAAAASAGAGGGTGGGGLSTTTLALTGAAVAGGALAAVRVAGGDGEAADEIFTGNLRGQSRRVTTRRTTGATDCIWTQDHTGTARMEIADTSGDTVDGRLNIEARQTVVDSTCPFGLGAQMTVQWSVPLNGTDSSIRGSLTFSYDNPLPSGSIQGTMTLSFEGARTGGTITGTLRMDLRETSFSDGVAFDHLTTGNLPLTLTKGSP